MSGQHRERAPSKALREKKQPTRGFSTLDEEGLIEKYRTNHSGLTLPKLRLESKALAQAIDAHPKVKATLFPDVESKPATQFARHSDKALVDIASGFSSFAEMKKTRPALATEFNLLGREKAKKALMGKFAGGKIWA